MYTVLVMKKIMKTLLVVLAVGLMVSASCDRNNKSDIKDMTDTEVLDLLTSGSAYKFEADDVCIIRPESFKGLILIGFFAHDRGCSGTECLYNREKFSTKSISAQVLNDNGWSDKELRESLILRWIKEVETVWSSLVETAPDKFGDGFEKPTATKDDKGYTAVYWMQRPAGMLPEDNYDKIKLVFNLKGEIISSEKLSTKRIKYKED